MADAGVSAVLTKLSELASAEATALLKVDGQIRTLRQRLGYLQAVVRGADQQRRGRASELLLLWVRETREVAFDVEDAVDEFHLKVETFQLKVKWGHAWYRSAVKLLHGLAMQIVARHVLSREITKINERIEEIDRIKDTYNIKSTPSEIWSVSFIDDDTTWDTEDGSVELRRDEFTSLKKSILDKDEMISHRAVISIIGPSGTGKTRLARNLYNDHDIQEHFEVLAWICLPPCIRFEQYVDMIYSKIRPQVLKENMESGTVSVRQNSRELKELLKEPKYLVVLDGVVDIGHWNSFLELLPSCNAKSRILITSKLSTKEIKHADKKVAPMVLHPLNIGQTCELFYERVFGAGSVPSWARVETRGGYRPWSMVTPGTVTSSLNMRLPAVAFSSPMPMENGDNTIDFNERVQNISRGLPLAAVVLGGILRAKDYSSEWLDLLSEKLETSKGQPKAMRCLWSLAFEDLPHHLKSCFLYLATAPENMLLDPDRLVRLWMAEGFISPKKGRTLEEVGLGYLKELVCRGLVEVVDKDARGGIKMVALHSLLHSFAQSEAQECSFLEIHHHANVLNPHVVRRLAIHNFLDSYIDIPDQFPKLRSLFCDFLEDSVADPVSERAGDGLVQQQSHWSNMAEWFLRACGCSSGPSGSTKLHHLSIIRSSRFLRVIDLHGLLLTRVPDEIGSIIHLRYLGVRNCRLQGLPESISKLDNLQTLDVRKTQVTSVTDGLWEISVLRHVLAETLHLSTRSPSARTMKNLQTLVGAEPNGEWQLDSCPLNNMIYLRTLAVSKVLEEHVDALSSALQKMEFLVSLSLSGRLLPASVFFNSSSRRLEVLMLDGRLNSSPTSPFNLPNIGKLTMSGSGNLMQDFLDQVSTMPNLVEMEFLDGSYIGAEMVIHEEGFPSLTKLNLANLEELDKLELVPGSAPKLAVLTKCGCTKMELIDNRGPQSAGHEEMSIVREIENPQIPGLAVTGRRGDVRMSRSAQDWGSSLQPVQTGTIEISLEEPIVRTEVSVQDMLVSVE